MSWFISNPISAAKSDAPHSAPKNAGIGHKLTSLDTAAPVLSSSHMTG